MAYWNTAPDNVDPNIFYRATVRRGTMYLGFIDIDVVSTRAELGTVNTAAYVGVARDEQVTLRFRIERGPVPIGLGSGIARAINGGLSARSGHDGFGLIVGTAPPPGAGPFITPDRAAFTFNPRAAVYQRFIYPYDMASEAWSVNESDVIAGFGFHEFSGSVFVQIPGLDHDTVRWMPHLPGGVRQFGGYISNAGEVAGTTSFTVNQLLPAKATLWVHDSGNNYSAIDLGDYNGEWVEPRGIAPNISGNTRIIVGKQTPIIGGFHTSRALIWQHGQWSELTCPYPSAEANAVSDNGIVVGHCAGASNPGLWINGQFQDLLPSCQKAVGTASSSGGTASAIAVTPSGRVLIVGRCVHWPAVWYSDGNGGYSAEILPLLPGDTFGEALGVNASGTIVGYGARSGVFGSNAVRWDFRLP